MTVENANRLGYQEYLGLLIVSTSTVMFFDTPRQFFLLGANAAWLSVVAAVVTATVIYGIAGLALEQYPGQSFADIAVQVLGRALGSAAVLFISLYFAFVAAFTLRILSESIVTTALTNLPISVIAVVTLLFAAYAGHRGWNAIAKSCWVSLPFLALAAFIPLVLTVETWMPDILFPLLGHGAMRTLLSGAQAAGVMSDIVLAIILAGGLQKPVSPLKAGVIALALSGFLLISVVLAVSMVFPYPVAAQVTLPYYSLSRTLTIGRFLQRLEALTLLLWAFATVLKVAISAMGCVTAYAQVFGIRDRKPIILPTLSIVFALSMLPGSFFDTGHILWLWVRVCGGAVSLILPALVAVVALVRRKAAQAKGGPS